MALEVYRWGRKKGTLPTTVGRAPAAQSAAGRPIIASAQVQEIGDARAAVRARSARQGWQSEAFAYLDGVGELRYAVQTSANAISRVRLFPAIQLDPREKPVALDDVGTADVPRSVVDAAYEDMAVLNEPGHGLTSMQHNQSINKQVVGEYYIVGIPGSMTESGEDEWGVRSIDEVVIDTDGRWYLRDRPPGFAGYDELPLPLNSEVFVSRCWDQHPRFRALAWSQMRPLLESLEELMLASRMIRSTLRSRIAGAGLLLVPDELELLGVDPTAGDAQANPFFEELTKAMLTPIQSEGDASEVVPLVVRGPAEILKELRHLTLDRPIDQTAMAIRGELIRRIAIGIDWPPELLLGVGDVSHWAQWFVDESTFRYHYEPQAISAAGQWTYGFAQPMLQARGWDGATLETVKQIIWSYDPGPLLTHPDRTQDALNLYDRNVLNDDELLRAAGFDPDKDKPTQADFLVRLMSKFRSFPPNVVEAIIHRYDPSLEIPADKTEPGYDDGGSIPPEPDGGGDSGGGTGGPPRPPAGDRSGRGGPPATPGEASDAVITAALSRLLGDMDRERVVISGTQPPLPLVADAAPAGAMLAVYPTPEQADALAVDGGEPAESLHVTLAYLGRADDLTAEQLDAARTIAQSIAGLHGVLEGVFSGVGRFTASASSDGLDPVVATPDVQGLSALRHELAEKLTAAGVPLPSEHGWNPHCTLAYVAPDERSPVERLEPVPATFAALSLCVGGNRTDFPLRGPDEPVVAAGSSRATRASRRLGDIDARLRARLRAAADAAVKRQLEKAAARVKSRLNGQPELRSRVRDVPADQIAATLGRETLTAAGIDLAALTGSDDYAALQAQFYGWTEAAQTQALKTAGQIAPLSPGAVAAAQAAHAQARDAAWAWLAAALATVAADRLFDPSPEAPAVGEFDGGSVVGAQMIRAAVAIAGGYGAQEGAQGLNADGSPVDPSERLGGIGTGVTITATLEDAGAEVEQWEWAYGASVRSFEPHVALDGVVYTSHDDDQLVNTEGWPETEFFFPGDHLGCDCTETPSWTLRVEDAATADQTASEDPSATADGA